MHLYRWLLRLLPRARRERFGEDMARVFADERTAARARSPQTLGMLWMKEAVALIRVALRERRRTWTMGRDHGGSGRFRRDLRAAWRAVRSRGWRAAFTVVLLGLTLGANTIVFSTADSLVFHRSDYPHPDELVTLEGVRPQDGRVYSGMPSDLIPRFREFKDLFAAVHGTTPGSLLINRGGEPLDVRVAYVTPGLLETLGATPQQGRLFADSDLGPERQSLAIVRRDLARTLFGDARNAVGRVIHAEGAELTVVGVLPNTFRFLTGSDQVWRPWSTNVATQVLPIARLAPAVTIEQVQAALAQRSPSVTGLTAFPRGWPYIARPAPFIASYGKAPSLVLWSLLGAAICLLLTTCATVVNLELASASARTRDFALLTALGASAASLTRTVVIEGTILVGAATALAAGLAIAGTTAIATALPALTVRTSNAIDLDVRSMSFMVVAAGFTWFLTSLPALVLASRASAATVLRADTRVATASRLTVMAQRGLSAVQVAVAVCLLIGTTLALRSYIGLVTLDKGFDSTNLVNLEVMIPPSMPRTAGPLEVTRAMLLDRIRSLPFVESASLTSGSLPQSGNDRTAGPLEIDGTPIAPTMVILCVNRVSADYFSTMQLPIVEGRVFSPEDTLQDVIVPEHFARRFWPGESAVGRRFRNTSDQWYRIVGVNKRVRYDSDRLGQPSTVEYNIFTPAEAPSLQADTSKPATGRESWVVGIDLVIRLSDLARISDVVQAARSVDSRLLVTGEVVDSVYRDVLSDTRAATTVVTCVGVLAFLIATGGVYGVVMFLVVRKEREIGIRMALGADRHVVARHIFGSTLRFVIAGGTAGLACSITLSRFAQSQLFGVSPTDPLTYSAVTAAMIATAMVATLAPARAAARVDPAKTLRGE